jgi:hypothetical protein
MNIKILGAESLGVRGLCCSVELKNRKILIDPGISLGLRRCGLLPHPLQIAVGASLRERIIEELKGATDVVFSHFHGDHCPLYNANPYQLAIKEVKDSLSNCRIWAKRADSCEFIQQRRREELATAIGKNLETAEGKSEGPLAFSFPVAHGQQGKEGNTVMMSRIEEEGKVFVHASDVQLLDAQTTERILDWSPDIVFASGPPLYRDASASNMVRQKAWENAAELSERVDTLIIDHHPLRSQEGVRWLKELSAATKNKVLCAADFMRRQPAFLEAWRKKLYEWVPVYEDWHEDYQHGKADVDSFRVKGWESLVEKKKVTPCKWYYCCPIRRFTEQGKLERYWIENYCLVGNEDCVRYQMQEKGEYHPDNMLPNGETRENLE